MKGLQALLSVSEGPLGMLALHLFGEMASGLASENPEQLPHAATLAFQNPEAVINELCMQIQASSCEAASFLHISHPRNHGLMCWD